MPQTALAACKVLVMPGKAESHGICCFSELKAYGVDVDISDPWASAIEAKQQYGVELISTPENGAYDAVVIAVAHNEFKANGVQAIRAYGKSKHVLYDLKCIFETQESDLQL